MVGSQDAPVLTAVSTPTPTPTPAPAGQEVQNTLQTTFSADPLLITGSHKSYLSGYAGGYFKPEASMTRAEVAQMLYNLLAAKLPVSSSKFSDVNLSKWYGTAVNALAASGVLKGYNDGTFMPGKTITRAEFVTALTQCFSVKSGNKSFSDVPSTHWAYRYISSATAEGWLDGYSDGTFRPGKAIKRCEAVKIVNTALGRKDKNFASDRGTQEFVDVPSTHWAFLEIAEAADPVDPSPSPSPSGPVDSPKPSDFQAGASVRVTANSGLNMRESPDGSAKVVTVLTRGTVLTVTDNSASPWLGVKTAAGQTGYVHSDYVEAYTPSTNASGASLSASSLSCKQYQTLRLDGSVDSGMDAMRWSSSDPDVAVVGYAVSYNSREAGAMVYGKNPGTAVITFSNGGNVKASCSVTVGSAEPVRFAYADENTVGPGEKFRLMAVTDTGKTGVRFQVTGGPGSGTYETTSYTTETRNSSYGLPANNVRVFSKEVSFNTPGTYTLRAYSKGSGSYSSDYKEFTVFVSSSSAASTATSSESRRASTELLHILENFEGSVPEVEDDRLAAKNPTVGFGYVVAVNSSFYNNLTSSEMFGMLVDTVNNRGYADAVNNFRSNYGLKMSQAQFDALVSFVYNCGQSTLNAAKFYTPATMVNAVVPPADLSPSKPYSGVLNVGSAKLWKDTSLNSPVVATVPNGKTVSVIGVKVISASKQVWYQAKYGSQTGWIPAGYVRLTASGLTHDLAYADSTVVANNLLQWHTADSVHIPGLLWRRLAECKIYFYGNYKEAYHSNSNYRRNEYGFDFPCCEEYDYR